MTGPGVADRGDYDARALSDNYKCIVDYGLNAPRTADPEVFWKLKFRDSDAVRVLPEAPLWRLERELARKDKETYDFIKRPPATQKKRRSVRPGTATAEPSVVPASTASRRRRDTFSPRSTSFAEERSVAGGGVIGAASKGLYDPRDTRRSSAAMLDRRGSRARSKSRPRSAEFDRESLVREEMPHRKDKDKTWWEGRKS